MAPAPDNAALGTVPALVIFDCDGTLVDSEPIAAQVNAELLSELGWPITEEEVVQTFIGCSAPYFRSVVESRLGGPLPAWWDRRFRDRFEELAVAGLRAVVGVEAVVAAVAAAGVPMCVASNSRRERTLWKLARTGLASYFDEAYVFSGEEVAAPKPAPDVYLHALDVLGVAADRAVVVEDSAIGVEAARRAQVAVYGYAGGLTSPNMLVEATVVFEDMVELPALLGLEATEQVSWRGTTLAPG